MQTDDDAEFESTESLVRGTVERLRRQGRPCKSPTTGGCFYRGMTDSALAGMGCAVGVWLPDTARVRGLGGTINTSTWLTVVEIEPRLTPHHEVLKQLQVIHDGYGVDDGSWDEFLDRWADPKWRLERAGRPA